MNLYCPNICRAVTSRCLNNKWCYKLKCLSDQPKEKKQNKNDFIIHSIFLFCIKIPFDPPRAFLYSSLFSLLTFLETKRGSERERERCKLGSYFWHQRWTKSKKKKKQRAQIWCWYEQHQPISKCAKAQQRLTNKKYHHYLNELFLSFPLFFLNLELRGNNNNNNSNH